jgi:hypothetical protein
MDSTKIALRQVMPNLCFSSGGIYRSCSAFWCVWGVKRWHTIFHAQVGPARRPQKVRRDMLHWTCVFCIPSDMWVTKCIQVRLGREMSTHHFSCSGGTGTDCRKSARNMLCWTCVSASSGIYGLRGAFRWDHGMKRRCTIFHTWVWPVRISQNLRRDMLC